MRLFFTALFALSVLMLVPDLYVMYCVADEATPYQWYQHEESFYLIVFIAALLLARSITLKIGFISVLFMLQLSELIHFSYFGVFYSQYSISYMFSELGDFFAGVTALLPIIWPTLLLSCVCCLLVIGGLLLEHKQAKHWRSNIPAFCMIFLSIFPFIKALNSTHNFKPTAQQLSVRNGLWSWNYFFVLKFRVNKPKEYQPYQLSRVTPKLDNLVLILGESANPYRMSIFGAKKDNTPFLNSQLYSPDFHHQLALSSSVATQYSLGFFLNGVYEPDNILQLASKETNLFKLAEDNGYHLHFISNHPDEKTLSHSYRYGHFDTWIDQSLPTNTWGLYDEGMLQAYLDQRGEQRTNQFLVLHMHNMHFDYKEQVPPEWRVDKEHSRDHREQLVVDYDHAVKYFDYTLESWVKRLRSELDGRTLVVYVPDHGEKLGNEGTWGHGHLDIETATIPIFAFNLNQAELALSEFKSDLGCLTSHYKIHRALAKLIGTEVHNPQLKEDQFFVSGLSLYGSAGWLKGDFAEHESLCQLAQRETPQTIPLVGY